MTVTITSRQEKLIQDLVKKGRFISSNQAISKAIELLEEEEQLLKEINKGINSGPSIPFDKEQIIKLSDKRWDSKSGRNE